MPSLYPRSSTPPGVGYTATGGVVSSGSSGSSSWVHWRCDLTIDYTGKGNEGGVEVVGRWTMTLSCFSSLSLNCELVCVLGFRPWGMDWIRDLYAWALGEQSFGVWV